MRQEQVRRRHQRADPFGVERAQRIERFGHSRGAVVHAGDQMIVEIDERGRAGGRRGHERGVCGNDRAKRVILRSAQDDACVRSG